MLRSNYTQALEDYKKARRKAAFEELLARIAGRSEEHTLLSYEDVRRQLRAIEKSPQRLRDVPLDAIVGSVGRYHDFTRKFLPRSSIDGNRWARVLVSSQDLSGLPPIEVYQIGGAYFVKDGNHRVSVAKQMGDTAIQAFVTAVESKVDLSPEITPDDLIIKSEHVRFLEKTHLDHLRPGSDLTATKAGAYPTLLEHIAVHRYYMGMEQQREISFPEAAAHWYDEVFLPIVNLIQKRELLIDFPDRTAADLYLWAADHRAALEENLGWEITPEAVISDLSEQQSPRNRFLQERALNLVRKILPDNLESGPPPGAWRERLTSRTVLQHLFNDLIVTLDNSENSWFALEMATQLSKLEISRVHGLHIHPKTDQVKLADHQKLQDSFSVRCRDEGISSFDFKVVAGEISKILCNQSRFADLIILPLNHPPGNKPIDRLSSGLTTIIRNCPVPVLTVPVQPTGLGSILLAFDGSSKAQEALYVTAYLGSQHGSRITILTSSVGLSNPKEVLAQAKTYLSRFPISTRFLLSGEQVSKAIAAQITEGILDLLVIGGYGGSALQDVMLGSTVDNVLREIQLPTLICR